MVLFLIILICNNTLFDTLARYLLSAQDTLSSNPNLYHLIYAV